VGRDGELEDQDEASSAGAARYGQWSSSLASIDVQFLAEMLDLFHADEETRNDSKLAPGQ
jgi:hypothetical protein